MRRVLLWGEERRFDVRRAVKQTPSAPRWKWLNEISNSGIIWPLTITITNHQSPLHILTKPLHSSTESTKRTQGRTRNRRRKVATSFLTTTVKTTRPSKEITVIKAIKGKKHTQIIFSFSKTQTTYNPILTIHELKPKTDRPFTKHDNTEKDKYSPRRTKIPPRPSSQSAYTPP